VYSAVDGTGFGRSCFDVGRQKLSLHVPEPSVRPGGEPDFSNVQIPQAGTVERPPVDVDPRDIRDMAFSIIRVLNRKGEAVGPWAGTRPTRKSAWASPT
jgi:hypothetical protein